MRIFTKRNALVGWVTLRLATRKLRARVERPQGKKRRRGLLVAGAFAAGATVAGATAGAIHLHRRRESREPTYATP
ncbi:hypothetical protein [Gaiella sp.]|uniref:hypothetical protein n=1 Tax=Gaiella sp. TaxID=2663207 RepID=UPI002E358F09|nr:hypothetical protein [Gaiella sp.]HEX5583697.1 hypothetical protein [Gaiella sp.]